MNIASYIVISLIMFSIGVIGTLSKKNTLILFLSIELMLNAANLLFVGFSDHWGNLTGQIWVFFVLVIAAAEAAAGVAIIINLFRAKQVVDIDQYNDLKG